MRLSVLSAAYPLAATGPDAPGGSEQILTLLDRALVRGGHRSVVVACEGSVTEGRLLATPRAVGELNEAVRRRAHEEYKRVLCEALNTWDFDLIHMHGLDFHAYLPPPGVPVLVTLHLPPDWYPERVFRLTRPQTWLHCVSASQQAHCPPSDVLLPFIPNGVPLAQLRTSVRKRGYALALGRICPEKGYHLALDAAARADVPLLLAGELFRYRAHEEYFASKILPRLKNGTRRFIGPVGTARKRRLLAGAQCLLVPSRVEETSSLVAMEAMACGTPVIAFPAGALSEIVEHGRTGFLVADEREMAEAIGRVGEIDPEECRRVARERFSAERMVERYMERYRRLVSETRRAMAEPLAYGSASE